MTLAMSMLLIITFAMCHQLSGTALADLLTLIDLHLISPNCFSRSMATLHKFFKQLKNPIQFQYYCSFCYEYIGIHKPTCCSNKHCLQDFSKKDCHISLLSLWNLKWRPCLQVSITTLKTDFFFKCRNVHSWRLIVIFLA